MGDEGQPPEARASGLSPEPSPPGVVSLSRVGMSLSAVVASVVAHVAQRFDVILSCTAAFALTCKLWLALCTYGTNDVYAYEQFASWASYLGSGIYHAAWDFNHPPSMIPVLRALHWLAETTGVFFPLWLRALPSLADAGTLLLVYRIAQPHLHEPRTRWGLLVLAASPALLLVSGFHGNTDSVMVFFLMLSVYWTDRRPNDLAAGVAFSLAACVKIVPVIALPALLLCRAGWKRKLGFIVAAEVTLVLGWMPWMLPDLEQALSKVAGYRGQYGLWGLSWIASHFFAASELPNVVLRSAGVYLLLGAIFGLTFVMSRRPSRPPAYAQVGMVFFVFLAGSNAFGVQYLAWLPAWAAGLALGPVVFFTLASGSFLLVVYNYWAKGLPWYLADSNHFGGYQEHIAYFQVLCWVSVLGLCWSGWARVSGPSAAFSRLEVLVHGLRRPMAWAMALVLVLPGVLQVRKDARGAVHGGEELLVPIRAAQDVGLSSWLLRSGRYDEAIEVAQRALRLDPTLQAARETLARAIIQKSQADQRKVGL